MIMPRVARIKSKSKIYHIMIRGINQQNIFSVDEDDEKEIRHLVLSKYQIELATLQNEPTIIQDKASKSSKIPE